MAKTARDRDADSTDPENRPTKKAKKSPSKATSGLGLPVGDALISALTDLFERSIDDQDVKSAKIARRAVMPLLERIGERLASQRKELEKLAQDDGIDYAAATDELREAIAEEEDALERLAVEVEEEEAALEEDEEDLEHYRKSRTARVVEEAKMEKELIHPVALALYPADDEEKPIPTLYNSWEDPFLIDLAQTLQPRLQAMIKEAKKQRKKQAR